jgi:hypothetical protein
VLRRTTPLVFLPVPGIEDIKAHPTLRCGSAQFVFNQARFVPLIHPVVLMSKKRGETGAFSAQSSQICSRYSEKTAGRYVF